MQVTICWLLAPNWRGSLMQMGFIITELSCLMYIVDMATSVSLPKPVASGLCNHLSHNVSLLDERKYNLNCIVFLTFVMATEMTRLEMNCSVFTSSVVLPIERWCQAEGTLVEKWRHLRHRSYPGNWAGLSTHRHSCDLYNSLDPNILPFVLPFHTPCKCFSVLFSDSNLKMSFSDSHVICGRMKHKRQAETQSCAWHLISFLFCPLPSCFWWVRLCPPHPPSTTSPLIVSKGPQREREEQ